MSNDFSKMAEEMQRRISEVAYTMWEAAGRQHGMAMEYWLAAEREVLRTVQAAADRLMPTAARDNQPSAEGEATAQPAAADLAVEEPAPASTEPNDGKKTPRRRKA